MEKNELEFETLKSNKNRLYLLCGIVCVVVLLITIIVNNTLAKYRVSDSVPIINSEINYKVPDLNMVSLYVANEDGSYVEADTIPSSGYILNTEQSYCGQSNNGEIVKDDTVSIIYENGSINVNNITKKGTKCYLYFDEELPAADQILAGKDIQTREDFSTPVTDTTTGVIYETTDWKGTSYYFAGAPTDNWVRFGGFYWRIVRVNGDGSVRLIYNGTSTTATGTGTMINNGAKQQFNSSHDRSEYVGLKYTEGSQHGQTTDSPILNTLQSWYTSSNLDDYADYIDTSVGFCSDRNMASGYSWSSQPSSTINYAAYGRLDSNKSPSLACTTSDIIAEPVGLITADEVALAGGVYGTNNTSYYLYNNQYYWTMSPYYFNSTGSYAVVFYVYSSGGFSNNHVHGASGVRPVINLSADVTISGSGTSTDPYLVS